MNTIAAQVGSLLDQLRQKKPLIHNITNYVTVNDVANAVLAIGASPIMADDREEAADIAAISNAVVLNIGTLNARTVESMVLAGKRANEMGIPVILDPVGAGASQLRNKTTEQLLSQIRFSVIRGNLSEIGFVSGAKVSTKGVDTAQEDAGQDPVAVAKKVAKAYGCVAAITGAVDVVSDGVRVAKIRNGVPQLSLVTGTGCMSSALVGSFAGAGDSFLAAVGGIASMGIAGEMAWASQGEKGTGSFHIAILDSLSRLDGSLLGEKAKIDEE